MMFQAQWKFSAVCAASALMIAAPASAAPITLADEAIEASFGPNNSTLTLHDNAADAQSGDFYINYMNTGGGWPDGEIRSSEASLSLQDIRDNPILSMWYRARDATGNLSLGLYTFANGGVTQIFEGDLFDPGDQGWVADDEWHQATLNLTEVDHAVAEGTYGTFYLRWNEQGWQSHDVDLDNFQLNAVPEPASLALLGLGGLAMLRRRR